MKKTPKISIIFCSLEGEYLKRTIPSLLDLRYPDYEIICVWTGNTDGISKLKEQYPSVRFLKSPKYRSKNIGTNFGVNSASGEYLFLLDDDVVVKDKLLLRNLLEQMMLVENFGCFTLATENEGNKASFNYGSYFGKAFTKDNEALGFESVKSRNLSLVGHPSGIGIFASKEVWLKVGGYDEDYIFGGDDSDLGIRLWLYGYKCYLYSKTIQLHIGMSRRSDNKKYSLYYGDKLFAHLGVITKNYLIKNFIVTFPLYLGLMFMKSLKQSLKRKMLGPIQGFFRGIFLYLKNLGIIISGRKNIQENRIVKKDIFLEIKP